MSTPSNMNSLLERIQERFNEARADMLESSKEAMNSYGAGYDQGYYDALGELIESITGDPAIAVASHDSNRGDAQS